MEAHELMTLLDDQLRKNHTRKALAETAGVARVNYYKVLKNGNITLPRFLKLLALSEKSLAQFAAFAEGKLIIEGGVLELHFTNEKLQLENEYLKRLLKACEDEKPSKAKS